MKFTRELGTTLTVRRVSADGFVIGDTTCTDTVALTPERIFEDWQAPPLEELAEADFRQLLEGECELILLGTGDRSVFPPRDLVFAMARRGIGFEAMDSKAAARTFNVLASEGRKVAAVLYV